MALSAVNQAWLVDQVNTPGTALRNALEDLVDARVAALLAPGQSLQVGIATEIQAELAAGQPLEAAIQNVIVAALADGGSIRAQLDAIQSAIPTNAQIDARADQRIANALTAGNPIANAIQNAVNALVAPGTDLARLIAAHFGNLRERLANH